MKRLDKILLAMLLLLPATAHAEISDINKIQEGATSFAEFLINVLAGPFGLILAFIGIVAAFFESKAGEAKTLIFITLLFTVGPWLLAMALKAIYL